MYCYCEKNSKKSKGMILGLTTATAVVVEFLKTHLKAVDTPANFVLAIIKKLRDLGVSSVVGIQGIKQRCAIGVIWRVSFRDFVYVDVRQRVLSRLELYAGLFDSLNVGLCLGYRVAKQANILLRPM